MTDYIERDRLMSEIEKSVEAAVQDGNLVVANAFETMRDLVYAFPAADVRPVVISDMPPHRWYTVLDAAPLKAGEEGYTGYLVYANGFYEVADYVEEIDGFAYFNVDGEYEPGVTHFLPLPPAPEGEK